MNRLKDNVISNASRAAIILIALVANLRLSASATEYFVSSAAQITTAMQTAQPGDVLTMTNGTWTNQRIQFAGIGTSGAPITLRAQTPGQVLLNGNSKINISGNWLVVDGLNFDGGALARTIVSSSFAVPRERPPTRDSPIRRSSITTRPM